MMEILKLSWGWLNVHTISRAFYMKSKYERFGRETIKTQEIVTQEHLYLVTSNDNSRCLEVTQWTNNV